MSLEKGLALVLKTVEFSETSRIATLFTREFGKITGLAKGARRLRSPFEAALDLLTVCRVVFIRKSSGGLDVLTEASVVKRFRPHAGELVRYYAGFYIAELVAQLTEPYAPIAGLFDEARAALENLECTDSVPLAVARFEMVALRELGYLPRLDGCARCGRSLEPVGRCFFSAGAGGILCSSCRARQGGVTAVSAGTIQALRWLAAGEASSAGRLRIGRQALGEIRGLLNGYVNYLAGRPFRLHRYLKG